MKDAEFDERFLQAAQHLRAGTLDMAESLCRDILRHRPDDYGAHHLLALCLEQSGRFAEAASAYLRAILASPGTPDPYLHLGNLCVSVHQPEDAISAYDQALAIRPQWPAALAAKARLLSSLHREFEALAAFRQAVTAAPLDVQLLTELGLAAQATGELDEALAALQQAAALAPENGIVLSNLANHLQQHMGRPQDALVIHRRAVAAAPSSAMVRYNHALTCLSLGLFEDGWRDYEWRWQARPAGLRPRAFARPQWDGSDLNDRVILLHAEQGYGDTIQFLRFVEQVRHRGGRVVLQVRPALSPLVKDLPGVEQVVTPEQDTEHIDTHLPLMSLPHALGLTREIDLAMEQPYLRATPGKVAAWHARMAEAAEGLRVGIVWAGDPKHGGDHLRSIPLPLVVGALSGVTDDICLFGLQKFERHDGGAVSCDTSGLVDLSSRLVDFSDTAAAIAALDLVITVDTAVAHLAGAMGRPVWVLLPFAPDWRWRQNRCDSPWYPTMRLFRQSRRGDWHAVLKEVATALAADLLAPMSVLAQVRRPI